MLENNEEISETLEKREFISKKSGLVIAMANRVNGSIFAKSLERFSLSRTLDHTLSRNEPLLHLQQEAFHRGTALRFLDPMTS